MTLTLAARLAALERRRLRLTAIEVMTEEQLTRLIDPHAVAVTDEQLQAIVGGAAPETSKHGAARARCH